MEHFRFILAAPQNGKRSADRITVRVSTDEGLRRALDLAISQNPAYWQLKRIEEVR